MEINTIKKFKYKGFECYINRVGFRNRSTELNAAMELTGSNDFSMRGWWLCGYVILPGDHPLNGYPYDDLNDVIDVHEGLTYSDNGDRNTWIIGFDCNHANDGDHENTEEFVVSEIQKLVDQLLDPNKDLRAMIEDPEWARG